MIVHISNLTGAALTGRLESGDNELIGSVWGPPGYVRLDSRHSQPSLAPNFLFLDGVGDWSFADYTTAKELSIVVVRLSDGTFRHLTVETY